MPLQRHQSPLRARNRSEGYARPADHDAQNCVQLRNGMSKSAITLATGWTRPQQRVARWIALGLTQTEAAEREGIPLRTVQYWVKNNRIEELADELHARGWERVDPQLWANLEHALKIQEEVFAGRRPPRDPVYLEARQFIDNALAYRSANPRRSNPDGVPANSLPEQGSA